MLSAAHEAIIADFVSLKLRTAAPICTDLRDQSVGMMSSPPIDKIVIIQITKMKPGFSP